MNRIKDFRTQKGLSQLALAKAIGVARQTINLIENDKYNPSLDLCLKLAEALETDLNSLFWHKELPEVLTSPEPTPRERCLPLLAKLYFEFYQVAKDNSKYKTASQIINRFLDQTKDQRLEGLAFTNQFESFVKQLSLELVANDLKIPQTAKPYWDPLYEIFQSEDWADGQRLLHLAT